MANEKEPLPGTRGWRVNEIRKELGLERQQMADQLAKVAAELRINSGNKWTPSRVTKLILGRQPMSLDDAAVIVRFAQQKGLKGRDWDWFVFGPSKRTTVVGSGYPPQTAVTTGRAANGKRSAG